MNGSISAQWARQIIAALVANDIRDFFVSPGARSAPLALAIAEARDRGDVRVCLHYDERGLAFAALGASQALARPTACLTTSGSAVANLLPACVEAFHSGTPLVLLTADRPPELRGTGANQTIQQPGIFGSHVLASADLPPPAEQLLGGLGRWIDAFLRPIHQSWPGPVHLNIPFREPLLPQCKEQDAQFAPPSPRDEAVKQTPRMPRSIDCSWFEGRQRGLILVGELRPDHQNVWPKILQLAGHLGWPVAADALSGGKGLPGVVRHLDLLQQMQLSPMPECILHLGGRLVARRVHELLSAFRGDQILQVRPGPEVLCAPGKNPTLLQMHPSDFCEIVTTTVPAAWSDEWRAGWQALDRTVEENLKAILDSPQELEQLSEPGLARLVAALASQAGGHLFLGNSMPVRDFDAMVGELADGLRVFGQRGASGIDGNIAHIAGFARACGGRVFALLGDLAVLHDLNSLALLRRLPVALVVPNNHGGGIFEFLPMDLSQNVREEFLETPHEHNFAAACSQFGLAYVRTGSANVIKTALECHHGPLFIEVPSNRAQNFAKHREISRLLKASLTKPVSR